MANTRELSQLASLINVNDETKNVGIITNQSDAKIGIGTNNPISKVDVQGDVYISGVITATSFVGDGSGLTNLPSGEAGGGSGGLGTAINYTDGSASPFSYIDAYATVAENLDLNTTNAGGSDSYVVSVVPNIEIGSGIAVTVGAGKTMVIDILQIGDL
jgi:hypothetical protein